MMTPESSEQLEKHSNSAHRVRVRGNTEYVRLFISDEPRATEPEMLQPQAETRNKSFMWWIKVFLWCIVIVILVFVSVKWGLPFVFEKVLHFHSIIFSIYICC